jgi:Icc protein
MRNANVSHGAIRLLQITDTHFSGDPSMRFDEIDPRASLASVLADIRANGLPVDAILATGDLSHDATPDSYVALREALQPLETPIFCLAGNHDDPTVMQDYLTGGWVTRAPAVTFDAWQVIVLDTQVPGAEHGELGAERLALLHGLLEETACPHVLIAIHHPPVPIASPWMDAMGLRDAADFLDIVDRSGRVRAIVWGHVHQIVDQLRGGIRMLATPSTCIQFQPGATRYRRDPAQPGYRTLTLHPDGRVESAVVRVDLPSPAP